MIEKKKALAHLAWRLSTAFVILWVLGCSPNQQDDVSNSISRKSESEKKKRQADSGDPATKAHGTQAKSKGVLFDGWDDPLLTLFITGRQHGYIEPCGCTGLANQKGGLARRHTLLRQLNEKGWPLIALDVGNQVRRYGRQAEIKFQIATEGLKKMNYRAVALGPDDLRLSAYEVAAVTANSEEDPSPFVCANVAILNAEIIPRFHVIEAGGKKVGITAILGENEQNKINNDLITMMSAEKGLQEVWPQLAEKNCDLYVLLAHAGIEESKRLAEKFPKFNVVITAGGADEPAYQPEKINDGKSILVQVGAKGMYAGVVGVFSDTKNRLRYQRVPMDDRYKDSQNMLDLLAAYQEQIKSAGLSGLGIKPLPHPSGNQFVGSQACADCHTKAFDIWKHGVDGKGGPHAHATQSLIHPGERSEIARHFDPECLSCHVTGWNPQKYYPYISGYLSLEKTPLLLGNGCENCHGPGSKHVAAENGDLELDEAAIEKLRAAMRLPLSAAEQKCMKCHDLDNSPDFHVKGAFEKYWKQIEHKGLD